MIRQGGDIYIVSSGRKPLNNAWGRQCGLQRPARALHVVNQLLYRSLGTAIGPAIDTQPVLDCA